jgi:hypothetical protein
LVFLERAQLGIRRAKTPRNCECWLREQTPAQRCFGFDYRIEILA